MEQIPTPTPQPEKEKRLQVNLVMGLTQETFRQELARRSIPFIIKKDLELLIGRDSHEELLKYCGLSSYDQDTFLFTHLAESNGWIRQTKDGKILILTQGSSLGRYKNEVLQIAKQLLR